MSKCGYCGEHYKDRDNFVDCDNCGLEDLCPNCYEPQNNNGNICPYCDGTHCPPVYHPDSMRLTI